MIAWITQDEGDTTVTPTTLPDVVSTVPPTQVTTTTAIPTTTTSTTTTTTTTTTTLPIFEATGDPIATEDLSLQAEAMGVLSFGTIEGFGRLVATFGQPDARFGADASWGICEDDIGFVAQWGPLSGIFIGSDDLSTFEGYRLVNAEPDHPASVLATLSGVRVGDTVADLEETYGERFTIVYEEINGVPSFILLGSSDATLLWGPLSSTESDGFVDGINSPVPCDGGPAPSS